MQQYIKKMIQYNQVGYISGMQGWLNICKSINIMQNIKTKQDKNNVIMSIDAQMLWQNLTSIHDKNPPQNRVKDIFLKVVIFICNKANFNIALTDEYWTLRTATRKDFYVFYLYSIYFG